MNNKYASREMFDKGVAAYVKKDFKTSVDLFSRAITYDPSVALFYVSRGAARLKLDKAQAAIHDFDRAIDLDPAYVRAYHLRGIAYEKLGELALAFQDFDRSLEIDPEYGAAYLSRQAVISNPTPSDLNFEEMEMVSHLMAMRLKHFDEKVPSDLAI